MYTGAHAWTDVPDYNLIIAKSSSLCLANGFDTVDEDLAPIFAPGLSAGPLSLNLGSLDDEGIDRCGCHVMSGEFYDGGSERHG